MQFSLAMILALSASVLASPTPQASPINPEDIVILDFSARHQNAGLIDSVGLHITGHDAENLYCGQTGTVVLGEKYACGDSKYSFALVKGLYDTWGVRIFHQWGVASGTSGFRDVPTFCHGGPLGSTICTLQTIVSLYIDSTPKDW
ncbi:protein elicitor protein [Colletotrichum tofieldiae]|uniref:Protein elicitor protein n=1 Tax=Colletotrichum tofieldiae TaxID=708197 RepID=A0A161VUT0_9PEZI|nr:protein elicitor protein [Colletotrichum tofieldiae]GKT66184.1 protein elicitor protein [Colletotrichum tofieldiae]GKT70649.1 protein elicitor protein [Colletotrichum tofieldiae]GKT94460.1 protein elicitor protein [Colletotrichum tofieldiae]